MWMEYLNGGDIEKMHPDRLTHNTKHTLFPIRHGLHFVTRDG